MKRVVLWTDVARRRKAVVIWVFGRKSARCGRQRRFGCEAEHTRTKRIFSYRCNRVTRVPTLMHLWDLLYLFDLVQHRDAITFTVAFDFDNLQGISDEKRVKQISRATQHIVKDSLMNTKKHSLGLLPRPADRG